MDQSRLREFVDARLEGLQEAMGIAHWKIVVHIEPIGQDGVPDHASTPADVNLRTNYNQAVIRMDPAQIDDEEGATTALIHELLHVVASPFRVYEAFVCGMIKKGTSREEQEDRIWTYCEEQAIINLERLWRGSRDYWRKGYVESTPVIIPPSADAPDAIC